MAQRRMFSVEVVGSDQFLDMPTDTRELYFHLGMYADDDGFLSPKKIIRMIGASEDNLKLLIAKGFVIPFESGIIVITHWRESNYIQKDRYKATIHQLEYKKLNCIQNVYKLDTQVRLGKDRIGKDISEQSSQVKKQSFSSLGAEVIKLFEVVDPKNKTYYGNKTQRGACDFLIEEYGFEEVKKRIAVLDRTNKLPYFPKITSPNDLKEKWVKLQDAVSTKRAEKKEQINSVAFK